MARLGWKLVCTPPPWRLLHCRHHYLGGLTELCPAIGSGAAPKGHGGPKVCALADQGAMAALRGRGAESGGLTHRP